MDCKKALVESHQDVGAAVDWLRQHGAARVSRKVAGRSTEEGLVGLIVAADRQRAALVQVASETDFASRSAHFVKLVEAVAQTTLEMKEPPDDENTISADNGKIKSLLDDAIVAIRENISVAKAMQIQSVDGGILVGYVHNKVESSTGGGGDALVGMSAAVVHVEGAEDEAVLQYIGKKLAMHVVAARPSYLEPKDVPAQEVAKERDLLTQQLADSGKPERVVEQIIAGRMRKYLQTVCLTEQTHMIEEDNPRMHRYLKDHGVIVKRFELLSIR